MTAYTKFDRMEPIAKYTKHKVRYYFMKIVFYTHTNAVFDLKYI